MHLHPNSVYWITVDGQRKWEVPQTSSREIATKSKDSRVKLQITLDVRQSSLFYVQCYSV